MSGGEQLAFELPHRTALGRDDFLVADSNRDAIAWIDRWPDWPARGLVVYGPPGSGKTHLATVWQARAQATVVDVGAVAQPGELASPRAVGIDNADAGADESAFKAFLDLQRERGGTILLTARTAPAHWPIALADLASRLRALPAVAIAPPDTALLAAVLVKQLADRQLSVPRDVLDYLLPRMERTFAAVRGMAAALDAASLARRRPITIAFAREVLAGSGQD